MVMKKEDDDEEERGGLVLVLDRKSSIEKEPPTLRPRQLQFATEAALGVMKNASVEEASKIFTQGLQVVNSCVHDKDISNEQTKADADQEEEEEPARVVREAGACRVHSFSVSRPLPLRGDIATAPF